MRLDVGQLCSRDTWTAAAYSDWLRDVLWAMVVRTGSRPVILTFRSPWALTEVVKQNALYQENGFDSPSNAEYRNNFLPFSTSKAQFYGLFHVGRSVSTLARAFLHWSVAENPSRTIAFAAGEALGDAFELGIMRSRYGRLDNGPLLWKLLVTAFYLRILALGRTKMRGTGVVLAMQQSLGNLLPLWWFIFTKQRSRARLAATVNSIGLLTAAYLGMQEVRRLLVNGGHVSSSAPVLVEESEVTETRLSVGLLSMSILHSACRAILLLRFAARTPK